MNKTTRMLAMTGIALAAGLTVGAGPASAAPAAPAAPATASVQADHKFKPSNDKFMGYFRSPSACIKTGRIGKLRHKWDSFDCDRVSRGSHRGQYSLTVSWDRRGPVVHGHVNQHDNNRHDDKRNNGPRR